MLINQKRRNFQVNAFQNPKLDLTKDPSMDAGTRLELVGIKPNNHGYSTRQLKMRSFAIAVGFLVSMEGLNFYRNSISQLEKVHIVRILTS